MKMRAGLRVSRVGVPGTGQVTRLRDGQCEVRWRGGRRDRHPQTDLFWVGLTIHARGGVSGRIVTLGYERVKVRFDGGKCCWLTLGELAPRQPRPELLTEP